MYVFTFEIFVYEKFKLQTSEYGKDNRPHFSSRDGNHERPVFRLLLLTSTISAVACLFAAPDLVFLRLFYCHIGG